MQDNNDVVDNAGAEAKAFGGGKIHEASEKPPTTFTGSNEGRIL